MNEYARFMALIEAYYGRYSDAISNLVLRYVTENYQEDELDGLYKRILATYSSQYKRPPDVAQIHALKASDAANVEIEALQHWSGINRIVNSYSGIVFDDLRLQYVIQGMGGWIEFCQRPNDPESETWARKRFVELYKMYTAQDMGDERPKMLRGMSDYGEPLRYAGTPRKQITAANNAGNKVVHELAQKLTRNMEGVNAEQR
jgi:hypothetical protein